MWKRDESVRTPSGPPAAQPQPTAGSTYRPEQSQNLEKDVVNIGKSVVIKGELTGSEDLTIEGQVEGTIQLRDHVLTIGPNGKIRAQVFAKAVIVLGEVNGNITSSEKVDIKDNGSVDGDIISPRVAIAEGAHFRGSVDMQRKGVPVTGAKPAAGDAKAGDAKAGAEAKAPAAASAGQPTPARA